MANLYPIFANPNPPSSFDGLDVSLVGGQATGEIIKLYNGVDASFNCVLKGDQLAFGINGGNTVEMDPINLTYIYNGTPSSTTWEAVVSGGSANSKTIALIEPVNNTTLAVVDRVQVFDLEVDPLYTGEFGYNYVSLTDNTASNTTVLDLTQLNISDATGLTGALVTPSGISAFEGVDGEGLVWEVAVNRSGFALSDAPSAGATPATASLSTTSLDMASGTDSLDTVALSVSGLTLTDTANGEGSSLNALKVSGSTPYTSFSVGDATSSLLITETSDPANPLTVDVNPLGFTLSSGDGGALAMSLSTASLNVTGEGGAGFIHSQVAVSGTDNVLTYSLGGTGLSFSDVTNPEVSEVSLSSASGLTILQDTNGVYLTPNALTMENTTSSGIYAPNGVTTPSEYTFTVGADSDTLVLPSDGLIYVGPTGGQSGDHLKITINGTPYLIALLSAPAP